MNTASRGEGCAALRWLERRRTTYHAQAHAQIALRANRPLRRAGAMRPSQPSPEQKASFNTRRSLQTRLGLEAAIRAWSRR